LFDTVFYTPCLQIVSFVRLHNYGNDIFREQKYPQNQEFTFETNKNATKPNHRGIPQGYTFSSIFSMVCILLITVPWYAILIKHDDDNPNITNNYSVNDSHTDSDDEYWDECSVECCDEDCCKFCNTQVTIVVIAMITTYMVIFFLPFMLLAFLHDPLQATLVYFLVAIAAACIYFVCLVICAAFTGEIPIPFCFLALLANASFVYFLVILCLILTLGTFSIYQELRNLLLPLIIVVLSVFVVKPIYKYMKRNDIKTDTKETQTQDNNDQQNRP